MTFEGQIIASEDRQSPVVDNVSKNAPSRRIIAKPQYCSRIDGGPTRVGIGAKEAYKSWSYDVKGADARDTTGGGGE